MITYQQSGNTLVRSKLNWLEDSCPSLLGYLRILLNLIGTKHFTCFFGRKCTENKGKRWNMANITFKFKTNLIYSLEVTKYIFIFNSLMDKFCYLLLNLSVCSCFILDHPHA